MNTKRIALVLVVVIAAAIVIYKQVPRHSALVASPAETGAGPKVILVADPSEAEEQCACGEIIRAVRMAKEKGVTVQEFPPDSESELLKQHRIMTAPTVLFLDGDGRETARYEGEDQKTLDAIRLRLKQITPGGGR